MPPKVSVVIPTYNRSALLEKSVRSVLDQTYKNYEILVIDNSSQDNTAQMLASLNDERIKSYQINNRGIIARSRNLGLQKALGAYIAFLDDDDLWEKDKLEKQVAYMKSHPHCGLVYTSIQVIDENNKRGELIRNTRKTKEGKVFRELIKGNFISQLTVLMRREVLDSVGYLDEDASIKSLEDYEYWLRISLKHVVGYIDEPLGLYRVHSSGVSKNHNSYRINQFVLERLLKDPDTENKDVIKERIYSLYAKSAVYNWKTSNRKESKEDLKKYLAWNLKRRSIMNLAKGASLYVILMSGLWRIILVHPKHFRRVF